MKIPSGLNQIFVAALVLLSGAIAMQAQVPQLLNYQGRIAVNGTNFSGTGQFKFALVDGGTNLTRTATGTATVAFGFLVAVNITDGGAGYAAPPSISVVGGGSGASFTVQISGGAVTNVIVNSAGSGYTTPSLVFSAPGTNVAFNTFWSNDGSSSAGSQPATSVPLPVSKGLYSVLLGDTTLSNMSGLPASVFAHTDVRLRVWFNDGLTGFQPMTPDQRLAAVGYAIMAGSVPDGSITASKIAAGAVGSSQLSSNLTIPGTLNVGNLMVNGSPLKSSPSYQIPDGTNIQTYGGGIYFITNTASSNFILPTNANVGDTIQIYDPAGSGSTALSRRIIQNAGQQLVFWGHFSASGPLVYSADGSRLLAGENAGHKFFLSTNNTASWTLQPPLETWPAPKYWVFQMSGDGSHIFAGSDSGIIVSGDYGQTWIRNTNVIGPRSIACSTNGVKAVTVCDQGIFTTTDSGSNWTLQTSAPTNDNWRSVASSADGTKLVAVAYSYWDGMLGGIYTSVNSGSNWMLHTSAPTTNVNWQSVASSADGTKVVAVASPYGINRGIYTSVNSGSNWTLQTSAPTNEDWKSVASSADGTKLAAASASTGGIYTSVNSGSSWMLQTNGLPLDGNYCNSITSSADGSKLAAHFSNDSLFTSVDLGYTWTLCSTVPNIQSPTFALYAISSPGTSGGAVFYESPVLIYLGNGMFTFRAGAFVGY